MDGNTKREPPISWRPSPSASLALADLIQRMSMKRNEVLNHVVIAAAHGKDMDKEAEKFVAAARGNLDRKASQAFKAVAPKVGMVTLTREERDAKIDAFQRKTGMASGLKKRG